MQIFAMKHNGQMPTNWSQVGTEIDLDKLNRQDLIKSPAYPLQEHYVFVTEKIPMLGYQEGNVILIRTGPVEQVDGDTVRTGRYVISTNDAGFYSTWVAETNVQKMLAQAGVTELPKPEPPVPATNAMETPRVTRQINTAPWISTPAVSTEKAVAPPVTEATQPSPVEISTNVQTASPPGSSSSAKWPLIVLFAVIAFGLAFVVLRKKE